MSQNKTSCDEDLREDSSYINSFQGVNMKRGQVINIMYVCVLLLAGDIFCSKVLVLIWGLNYKK